MSGKGCDRALRYLVQVSASLAAVSVRASCTDNNCTFNIWLNMKYHSGNSGKASLLP